MQLIRQSKFLQAALITAILGTLGWLLPFIPLKIVLAFIAVVILAFMFKSYVRHMAGFMALAIIIFLIPSSIGIYSHIILQSFQDVFHFPFTGFFKEVEPSKSIDLKSKVVIDGQMSVDIRFTDSHSIRLSDELDVSTSNDEIRIYGSHPDKKYIIEIGTDQLQDLQINTAAVSIGGECQINSLYIDSTIVNIKGRIAADRLSINGTGVNVNGELAGKSLYIDGTGINLKGEFEFEAIRIDGTGISFDMVLSSCSSLSIDGTGINGTLTYLGPDDLYLRADGTGGKITLRNKSKADIRIESSGIRIVRE